MRLSSLRPFSLTVSWLASNAKKPKAESILVMCESISGTHRVSRIRPRLGDKLEFMAFDPFIRKEVLYKEKKKLRSVREEFRLDFDNHKRFRY